MKCRSLFKSYQIIFLNIYLLQLMYLDWQKILDCIVTDSYSVGQAGKEMMAALIWAKQGTLHRTSCSFHDKVSGLSRHSLSWGVTVHQNSPISIMQCITYVSCQFLVTFLCMPCVCDMPWCYLCVSRLACDQNTSSVMHCCCFFIAAICLGIFSNSFTSLDRNLV